MIKKTLIPLLALLLALGNVSPVKANVKLPAIISDHMVLQQKTDAILWGWANPNEEIAITASWNNATVKVKANEEGKWLAKIKTIAAGGPYTLTFRATNAIVLSDVYLGEVWFCSGQSNMEWKLSETTNADSVINNANNSSIRMFTVKRVLSEVPKEDVSGEWMVTSPSAVKNFSAVAYHFGNELANRLKVPIGLINSSWGGTPAESWVKKEVLESDEDFTPILKRYEDSLKKFEEDKQALIDKKLQNPKLFHKSPTVLYNGMVKPLINYRIRGVIWYQGEANSPRAFQYRKLFPALIKDWRKEFKIDKLPFYYVQIAPFKGQNPEIREAQLLSLKAVDFVGMAVTADVGDCESIHPKNKMPVGKRLAYIALNKDYGLKNVEWQSPIYKNYTIEKNKIRVRFNTASDLLVPPGGLTEFTIAGVDQKFYAAKAIIEGKTVIVYSDEVKEPVAVRFAWKNCPTPNLFNKAGLPASPFRTDQWKGATEGLN